MSSDIDNIRTNDKLKRTNAYYANGQLARQTDALSNTTKYDYGFLNKLTKTYTPFDDSSYSITEIQYDKNGNVILTKQTAQKLGSASEKFSITQNEYNALGLLTKVTLSGTGLTEKNITKYFYNNAGVKTSMQTGLSSDSDTDYLLTEYEYDSWMRPIRTTDSTGYNSGTVTYDLNGNVLTSTDPNGNISTNTYDALNRNLTSNTVNPDDSSKNVSKSFVYDNMGKIKKTVSNGVETSYEYDSFGRKVKEYGSSFKGYFYVGISQYVDRSMVGISNFLLYSNNSYEYDDEMRIIKAKEGSSETVSYTYDDNGNKLSETLANGVISTYTYNNANKITTITNKLGNSIISSYTYSYYLDGSDACKTRNENGIIETTEYEYDGLKRLTSEKETVGSVINTYNYEYDDYSNRIQMTSSGTENFTTVYNYNDANGNYTALLQNEVKTIENENSQGSLLPNTDIKQTVYTYDENGNQLTKTTDDETETNTYNSINQLIGFVDNDTTATYSYNVAGQRVEKTVNGETINHVWGGNQIVADVVDNEYYEANCYVRGTNLVAKYNYHNGAKSEYTYYNQNAHGDVVNLTDSDGSVIKTYKYDAFGVEKNISDSDANAFRYCGEYFDKETCTIYLRARYYSPGTGRFISRDSFAGRQGDPLSLNLYTYCHNNPIQYADFNGHERIVISGGLDGEENFRYSFIETAIKQINGWKSNDFANSLFPNNYKIQNSADDITWIVADWNYTEREIKNFGVTAIKHGVNFMAISDKQELFDYINKADRSKDPIDAMSFFAHGTAFDAPGISNPGHKNDYALSLGYGAKGEHNNNLNIFGSDLSKINSSSFAKSSYTYFGSCRAGNKFNGSSFAQQWANLTGGSAKAATGKGLISGRTDYTNIYPSPFPGADTISALLGRGRTERQNARWTYGYSTFGSKNYPTINDGGKWKTFEPN